MTEPIVAIQYAATADHSLAALVEARQITHDKLIADLGPRRRSGVTWRHIDAPEGLMLLHQLGHTDQTDLRDFLREHPFGVLVVATAEAEE